MGGGGAINVLRSSSCPCLVLVITIFFKEKHVCLELFKDIHKKRSTCLFKILFQDALSFVFIMQVTRTEKWCLCFFCFFLLHLHEIMEGLYFHCSLSVCVRVCLSVCLSVNKIPAKRMNRFWRDFRYMVAYSTGLNPFQIGDLGSKDKIKVTFCLFFMILC